MRTRFIFPLLAILLLAWLGTFQPESVSIEGPQPPVLADTGSAVTSSGVIAITPPDEDQNCQTITLKNPTFQELRDFILTDPTNHNKFVLNQYECRHFATDVNNKAEAVGLRCAFVLLCFDRGQHAVIAFDTTDRGLVYIEPQTDARVHPEVGGSYQGREIKEILIAW